MRVEHASGGGEGTVGADFMSTQYNSNGNSAF